jgi:EAL domain-containing protein (putative c-di-GMP-specific phosphodiesterase class I)
MGSVQPLPGSSKLGAIVGQSPLRTHFQPIVELQEGHLFGFEALSRGPVNSLYENPEALFREARRLNLLLELEKECQRGLLARLSECSDGGVYVFFNLEPILLETQNFRTLPIFESLREVDPRNFVIELTERHNIHKEDSLKKNLHYLRNLGFKIALDDIGSGYSDLDSIVEFRPEFLKVSNRIINGIAENSMKQKVVSLLLDLSESFAFTIAEGIERMIDLEKLRELGVLFGQGFLLAKPTPEMAYINQLELNRKEVRERANWDRRASANPPTVCR